jgi:hypothetical protein
MTTEAMTMGAHDQVVYKMEAHSPSWRRIEPAIVPENIEPTDHQHR